MSDLSFAAPLWAHVFWAVAGLALALWAFERRTRRQLDDLVSPELQARLVAAPSASSRRFRTLALVAAIALAVLALMRPQGAPISVPSREISGELMIALDVSRSMLAEDVAPNRLERAKAEIRDLLPLLEGEHVGLIAFAGRASVLSPLTPDFSFFRLVLDEAGPGSVALGGTRLEEPIRKAMKGFRSGEEIARVLLLITDGEDHDTFPLDAAREAAERGIAIVAIGVGSETGSEIPITDPRTGARRALRGADGSIVRSRLDGVTLREIAAETGGVYIPAATGAIDLESIFERHVRRLVQRPGVERGRVVRRELYPFAVAGSLLCLLASALLARVPTRRDAATIAACWGVGLLCGLVGPEPARSEPPPSSGVDSPGVVAAADPPQQTPRERYNEGLLAAELEDWGTAAQRLEEAREGAGDDPQLRHRSLSAAGWVEAARAGSLLEEDPKQALAALGAAANRYRDVLDVWPDDADARHNLELVSRRARALEDALRSKDAPDVAQQLDDLVARQRAQAGALRGLAAREAGTGETAERPDRQILRPLSTAQRLILTDADALAQEVERERGGLEATEEVDVEERIRFAQLTQLQHYLHRSRERMGHSRRELRGSRLPGAHRRSAAAVLELKRARDQLREPAEILSALEADQRELMAEGVAATEVGTADPPRAPLAAEDLSEAQEVLGLRLGELDARLRAALAGRPANPDQAATQQRMREVEPEVEAASQLLLDAATALQAGSEVARSLQVQGLARIRAAREAFLDLKGLIELAAGSQQQLEPLLSTELLRGEGIVDALRPEQGRNLERIVRIDERLSAQETDLAVAREQAADDTEQGRSEAARLRTARTLASVARGAMESLLRGIEGEPIAKPSELAEPARRARAALDELRRLFLTIVEQLVEVARSQQELADDTEQRATREDPAAVAPLVPRQQRLGARAGGLANRLESESRAAPTGPDGGPGAAEQLRLAAEHTLSAQEHMEGAQRGLEAAPPDFAGTRGEQDAAVAALAAAIEALQPPQQDPEEQEPPDSPDSEESESPEDGEEEGDKGDSQGDSPQDPGDSGAGDQPESAGEQETESASELEASQLLQEVRDREAERRRARAERGHRLGAPTVERDW